jgi:hypothetical protein
MKITSWHSKIRPGDVISVNGPAIFTCVRKSSDSLELLLRAPESTKIKREVNQGVQYDRVGPISLDRSNQGSRD